MVRQLYVKHISLKKSVKRNTEKGRKNFLKLLGEDPRGSQSIEDVKTSDTKVWVVRISEKSYNY